MIDIKRLQALAEESDLDGDFIGAIDYDLLDAQRAAENIKKIINENKLFNLKEDLGFEDVEGQKSYHYKVGLNEEAFIKIIREILDSNGSIAIESQIFEILKNFLKSFDIEMWIGKDSLYLNKIKYNGSFDLSSLGGENIIGSSIKGALELAGEMKIFKINEEKTINEVPAESLVDRIEKSFIESKRASRDMRRVSDVRQIVTMLEMYYVNNGKYPADLEELLKSEKTFTMPEYPVSQNDNCTGAGYVYTVSGDGKDYKLAYCLEGNTISFKEGNNIATKDGMDAGNPEKELLKDPDNDGLNNYEEINLYGTDPNDPDTDKDGVSDGDEVKAWTNPAGEGNLPDHFSTHYGTLIKLEKEIVEKKNYQLYGARVYRTEEWEKFAQEEFGLTGDEMSELFIMVAPKYIEHQPTVHISIYNIEEITPDLVKIDYYNPSMKKKDFMFLKKTESGWKNDLYREFVWYKENDPMSFRMAKMMYSKSLYEELKKKQTKDSDGDGLSDYEEEYIYKTKVNNPDTDGDGYSDGEEVKNGYDPLVDQSALR
jgi:hypothetical protein